MKILVYEHISGGGYTGKQISPSILSEGFGMLRTVVSDFKVADHEITVFLDARLSKLNPPLNADSKIPIFHNTELKKILVNLAKINDAIYIIAPETEKTLQSLVQIVEETGKISLNSESSAVEEVSDKTVLYKVLEKKGLATPETITFDFNDTLAAVKGSIKDKLKYPLIFKPVDGTSCSGLSVVNEERIVDKAIAKLKAESINQHFVVQEFIEGEAASVSLLCSKGNAVMLSLNQQNVKISFPDDVSNYEGGVIPFDHQLKQNAFLLAEKVAKCFSGLRGYVGIDLVLSKNNVFILDVNPRLTTSYIGLSHTSNFNVAEKIIDTILKGRLPETPTNKGYSYLSKYEASKPTISVFQKISKIREVVSPPFPLGGCQKSCALILAHSDSLECSKLTVEEAKKHVLSIINRGN